MAEELEFKISSGLKNIIGKELITDDLILNRYTPQLCCGWDRSSNIFKREYTCYIDGRIKACKPLCV
jgi:hypothetical protein